MEAIGLVASIASITDAIFKIVDFWQSVENAPAELRSVTLVLRIQANLLLSLDSEREDGSFPGGSLYDSILKDCLQLAKSDVDQLATIVAELERRLGSRNNKLKRTWTQVCIHLKKDTISKLRCNIDSITNIINLLKTSRTQSVVLESHSNIVVLSAQVQATTSKPLSLSTTTLVDHQPYMDGHVSGVTNEISAYSPRQKAKVEEWNRNLGLFSWGTKTTTHCTDPHCKDHASHSKRSYTINFNLGYTSCRKGFQFHFNGNGFQGLVCKTSRVRPDDDEIFQVCRNQDAKRLRQMVECGEASVYDTDERGYSLFTYVMEPRHGLNIEISKVLFEYGAELSYAHHLSHYSTEDLDNLVFYLYDTIAVDLYSCWKIIFWNYSPPRRVLNYLCRESEFDWDGGMEGYQRYLASLLLCNPHDHDLVNYILNEYSKHWENTRKETSSLTLLQAVVEDAIRYSSHVFKQDDFFLMVERLANLDVFVCSSSGTTLDAIIATLYSEYSRLQQSDFVGLLDFFNPVRESSFPKVSQKDNKEKDIEDDSLGRQRKGKIEGITGVTPLGSISSMSLAEEFGNKLCNIMISNWLGFLQHSGKNMREYMEFEQGNHPDGFIKQEASCCRIISVKFEEGNADRELGITVENKMDPRYASLDPEYLCTAVYRRDNCLSRVDPVFIRDGKPVTNMPGSWNDPTPWKTNTELQADSEAQWASRSWYRAGMQARDEAEWEEF
ncbi:ankyrin repeat-containing protein [Phlyctema vagabunda]|uniref:Ankyrin repeat-containing protein n=1 Tax=Phlyctema vagabunda TaxID=108571 RepID=A0ABR4PPN1_9HELO